MALFRFLLCSTVSRLFKYPDQAFAALDFTGRGCVVAQDVYNHALLYSTPLTKQELKDYCETHVFKGTRTQMTPELFRKFFYPDAKRQQRESDSDDEEGENKGPKLPTSLRSASQKNLGGRSALSQANSKNGVAAPQDDLASTNHNPIN